MNLLFDLDGTLTDPFLGITQCISYSLEKLGRKSPPRENLRWCIGPPLRNSFAKLLGSDEKALIDQAISFYRERFGSIGLFENEIIQGIRGILENLVGKGHVLYVATSKPEIYAERIVNHFHLERHFKGIYGSELDGTRCDKSSLLSYILSHESIPSSDTIMIGDRKHDMVGAKSNGIVGIGVLWGYGSQEELETSGAFTCLRNPEELLPLIEGRSFFSSYRHVPVIAIKSK